MKEAKIKLNAADNSIESGFLKSAAHDIYFAAENAARALLLEVEGNIPRDKNKIWIKITNLQRRGIITTFTRADIDRTYLFRTKADYVEIDELAEITKDAILSAFGIVEEFVEEVERVLKKVIEEKSHVFISLKNIKIVESGSRKRIPLD